MRASKVLLASLCLLIGVASAQTYVELVLDASGSMWTRLEDGRHRIAAAKSVLADFVSGLPEDAELNVGLRIYGSEVGALDEGACEDSRLFVPMTGLARGALLETVDETMAQGATPIAYSLLEAAADFPAEAERRLIVLVTDGQESCGGDLQSVAEELQRQGFEVDLRIIGFDLDARAIDSFEGIGTFENATSASELAGALGRAVEDVVEERDEPLRVTAHVTLDGDPVQADVTFRHAVSEQEHALPVSEVGRHEGEVPAGTYHARIVAAGGVDQTFSDLSVAADGENTFAFDLQPVEVTLSVAPAEPLAGGAVEVAFEGAPATRGDRLTVVPVEAPDDAILDAVIVDAPRGSARVRTPEEAGTLEARYLARSERGGRSVAGRSAPFESTAVAIRLDAPKEVNAGADFEVAWEGRGQPTDYITIVPAGSPHDTVQTHRRNRHGSPSQLTAPPDPGDYEVRYLTHRTRTIVAAAPIAVTATNVVLEAPLEARAGGAVDVAFEGAANDRDAVTIVAADSPENALGNHRRVRQGNPAEVQVPSEPGAYEIRYVTQSPRRVLASLPLTVSGLDVTLDAAAEARAGSTLDVRFAGAGSEQDYITIVPAQSDDDVIENHRRVRQGHPSEVVVPDHPGAYEIRYVTQEAPRTVYARSPLHVADLDIALDAPDSVSVGDVVTVELTGDGNPNDVVTIVPVGSPDDARENNRPVRVLDRGIQAPGEPGEYEIRYQTRQSRRVVASIPLTVR